jgi:hypothetical protein
LPPRRADRATTVGGMTHYSYDRNHVAHLGKTGAFVIVPDQIAANQKEHDKAGTVFPAYLCSREGVRESDSPLWVRLNGKAYGLSTPRPGDMVVSGL